ncbi:helix-turn-helix domain-containing protein [Clostridium saudiense]|uniref:helix-turn-helix domain-containing protein n=1 Tax=Clostridium saudiense TaxID=1414720 RepID=UPI0018AB5F8D|nr:helix-turn-helix transcriptional regulator [Clostridium saudiense]
MSIGDRIKKFRKENRLTQIELAKSANISRSYLADIENNRYNASVDVLKAIAAALDISLAEILDDSINNTLTIKDNKCITNDLKKLMDEFRNSTDGTAYYNGQELDESDLDLIESAMKIALEQIKLKNKDKYTPKKYKK